MKSVGSTSPTKFIGSKKDIMEAKKAQKKQERMFDTSPQRKRLQTIVTKSAVERM